MATHSEEGPSSGESVTSRRIDVVYSVNSIPPWYLTILLGIQHYLTAAGSLISIPVLLSQYLCIDSDLLGLSELLSTVLVVSGLSTLLQTTLGIRLPIIQGVSASFLAPIIAILLQDEWKCPHTEARATYGANVNYTAINLPEIGTDGHREIWKSRIREIQGAIMMASVLQAIIGFSGIMGFLLRFIGPLSITPTISLIGLSLFNVGSNFASQHWWIALLTVFLITLFSQYLRNVRMKFVSCSRGKIDTVSLPVFNLFPVLLAIVISWLVCLVLTETNVLSNEAGTWGYMARTDRNTDVLRESAWFRVPYSGQWGMPTVSVASGLVMIAAVLASIVESIGDYYACARLSGAPPPPLHAVNRGIVIEGIGCLLAGAWGSGIGTTSFSQNVGAIGITKVGSRRVVQVGGLFMILLGCVGKFGALFATIPGPIIGGTLMVSFGMVTAVGLSNLQYVNMNSSRNIFIVGTSLFFGLSLPKWLEVNQVIDTGNDVMDQILSVLCSTSLFVGGMTGFILDNTIPGTPEDRGLGKWREATLTTNGDVTDGEKVYDLPLIQKYLNRVRLFRYIPVCPTFLRAKSSEAPINPETLNDSASECQAYRDNDVVNDDTGGENTRL